MRSLHANMDRIHPECLATGITSDPCTCDELFGYSADGECHRTRAIKIAERMEGRTAAPRMGHGPDADEKSETERSGRLSTIHSENAMWKRSEFLKCNANVPMVSDDRGLPPGYMDERKGQ